MEEAYLYWCYDPEDLSVYVGCQYRKGCNHKKFGITYFTSSKYVKPLFKNGKMKGEVLTVLTGGDYMWRKMTILDMEAQLTELFIKELGGEQVKNRYCNGNFCSKGKSSWNKNKHHTEESKKKMSEKRKGKTVGENHPMYGKHHTEESKRKNSESNKGKPSRFKNKHHTEETKKLISEKRKGQLVGERNGMYNKHHTEESKKKMSEKRKGKTVGERNGMYGIHRYGEKAPNYGRKYINNGIICKSVKKEDLNKFLEEGWKLGMLKKVA